MVKNLFADFKHGRTDPEDAVRSERPIEKSENIKKKPTESF